MVFVMADFNCFTATSSFWIQKDDIRLLRQAVQSAASTPVDEASFEAINFAGAKEFYSQFAGEINKFCDFLDIAIQGKEAGLIERDAIRDFAEKNIEDATQQTKFCRNIFLALEQLTLRLSDLQTEICSSIAPILDKFRGENSVNWDREYCKPGSFDMKPESLLKLRSSVLNAVNRDHCNLGIQSCSFVLQEALLEDSVSHLKKHIPN